MDENENITQQVAQIVTSYVANNKVDADQIPDLIKNVHATLSGLVNPTEPAPTPAVKISKSITDEYIICLEDGKKFKSLKRHLRTHYDLSPEEYREKWGLPLDYPMVAPAYALERSQLAKKMGLGRREK
jgi:predicted transcriptional regulator